MAQWEQPQMVGRLNKISKKDSLSKEDVVCVYVYIYIHTHTQWNSTQP